jgi:hypothetical protein
LILKVSRRNKTAAIGALRIQGTGYPVKAKDKAQKFQRLRGAV